MTQFFEAGLVDNTAEWLTVTPKGQLLVRAVAMSFDRYLSQDRRARQYSRIL
jgi:oxygen-independent coproporphyrinogen-3 oxidase